MFVVLAWVPERLTGQTSRVLSELSFLVVLAGEVEAQTPRPAGQT